MEFCTGMQTSEEELQEFLKENPNFPQDDPLEFNYERESDE